MGGSPFARYIHCDIYYCLTTVNKGLYGTGKLLLNILFIAHTLNYTIQEGCFPKPWTIQSLAIF